MEKKNSISDGPDILSTYMIPFSKNVKYDTWLKLANKLDPESVVMGNNWRLLADKLGYSAEKINLFDSQQTQHGRNTIKVLQDYSDQPGSTVNELYRALEEIERPDALDELKAALPGIEKRYFEGLEKDKRELELMENDCACPSCTIPGQPASYHSYNCPKHSMSMKNFNIPAPHYPSHSSHGHPQMNSIPGSHSGLPAQVGMAMTSRNCQRHRSVPMDPFYTGMASPNFDHQSPEFKRQKSESMVVRGHDSHSQAFRDIDPMDHTTIREDRVPLHIPIMRDRYNMISGMTAINNGTHLSTGGSMFRHPDPNHHRPGDRPNLKLDIPNSTEMFNRQRSGDFLSPSPTPTTPSTPLGHLQKLANDTILQPNEGYKQMLEMKRREEAMQGKAGSFGNMSPEQYHHLHQQQVPQALAGGHTNTSMATEMAYPDQRNMSPNYKGKMSSPPNTFPMRLKTNTNTLAKSMSVPGNMKPTAECRKAAFRKIKVFVTYEADDDKHTMRVLKLCNCLEKNGFSCWVDIFDRKLSEQDRHDWPLRFEEADFILIVMSNKYRTEVDKCDLENDDSDGCDNDVPAGNGCNGSRMFDCNNQSDRLHTKHIYRLMKHEAIQKGQCTRFVPLIFPNMGKDLIPNWLLETQNNLYYTWPKQYKDLLWMLTKPENRVPEHLVPTGSRCNSEDAEKVSTDASDMSLDDE